MDESRNPVDILAEDIRRVDGNHSLGAGALAQALVDLGYVKSNEQTEPSSEWMHWKEVTESGLYESARFPLDSDMFYTPYFFNGLQWFEDPYGEMYLLPGREFNIYISEVRWVGPLDTTRIKA